MNTCLVLWQPSVSFYSCLCVCEDSLSWVGLGPCADVGLIPRRVGSFCRIFTLKKYNTVCLLYLGNFSSIPFCCRIF